MDIGDRALIGVIIHGEFTIQPGPRILPVALDGSGGDAENRGGLFVGEAAEESHLNDLGLFGLRLAEKRQHFVKLDKIFGLSVRDGQRIVEPQPFAIATTSLSLLRLGVPFASDISEPV